MPTKRIEVFVYRHEGLSPQLPTVVSATVESHVDANGLRDRIKAAVTEWAKHGSEDAQNAIAYAGDDFNLGDLNSCLYHTDHIGPDDDGGLVRALIRHGVVDLVIASPNQGDWTYDTPLIEPIDEE